MPEGGITESSSKALSFHHTILYTQYLVFPSAHFPLFNSLTIPSSSCKSGGRSRQALIVLNVSHFLIYRSIFVALFLCVPSPSSLCVLPHGFPLHQCVALVITSCLIQTDGIRESDGQFSQCLFTPFMCTRLLYLCVRSECTLLNFSPSLSEFLPSLPRLTLSL